MIWRVSVKMLGTVVITTALSAVMFNTVLAETPVSLADIPVFQEQSEAAGVVHSYDGPWEFYVGGGGAGFDCNGDRFPDMALAGGANPAKLYVNESGPGGILKFRDISENLPERSRSNVTGYYPIDFNNDGIKDLVALRLGENLLLEGKSGCEFEIANRKYAFDGGRDWTTSLAATFEKDAAFPTIAIGNYVDRSAPGSPWGTCHDNYLHRPAIDEGLSYAGPQTLTPGYCSLSMIFTDWNRSGQDDLRITNDRQYYRGGQEQLFKVDPGRPAREYRTADGWRKVLIWGMGIAETDMNGDGYPEYALTSMGDTKLQTLEADEDPLRPSYRDIAFERGATAHRPYSGEDLKPSTGWHAEFADFNNDSRSDLFIAKGNVEAMPDFAAFDPDNLLLMQADGNFIEAGLNAGLAKPTKGRGAIITDFNMDGMLDIAIVNRGQNVGLFRNTGGKFGETVRPMGNWIAIELRQEDTNRDAVGATISVKTGNVVQTRRVRVGGGHASGTIGFSHIGLGVAERATIRIKWPDGDWSHEYRAFANNFVVIDRDEDSAKYWYPIRVENAD